MALTLELCLVSDWRYTCTSICCTWAPRRPHRHSCPRSGGRRTSHWASRPDSCTRGGGECSAERIRRLFNCVFFIHVPPPPPPSPKMPVPSVFWDLYCAAPERRDQCDHSSEAKAFHDYGFVSSGYNGLGHVGFPIDAAVFS